MRHVYIESVVLLLRFSMVISQAVRSPSESVCSSGPENVQHRLWMNLHTSDVSNVKVAVFPLGSIENHGPHLPFGTDLLLAEAIVKHAVSELKGVAVLPASPFGASFEHEHLKGTLPVQDTTLNGLWDDVLSGLVSSGLSKIVLVNAHGGQTQNVEIAIRKSRFRHNVLVVSFNAQAMLKKAWKNVETRTRQLETESVYGIHGGLIETAVMLYLFPNLVKTGERRHFQPRRTFHPHDLEPHGEIISFGWRSEDLSKFGALGDATSANAEIGSAIFNETVTVLRKLVSELLDTNSDEVLHPPAVHTSDGAKREDGD